MIFSMKKSLLMVGCVVLGLMSSIPVMADDTEIYLGASGGLPEVNPNILFIIDNSGSMDTKVETLDGYDPNTVYTGSCDVNRVYYTRGGRSPSTSSCGDYIDKSAFVCEKGINAFTTGGLYSDIAAQYRSRRGSYRWRSISNSHTTDYVECSKDQGVHGNGGSDTYAADASNGGPWRSDSSGAINWGSGYNNYTFRSGNFRNWQLSAAGTQKTRLEIVQDAVSQLINGVNDVNVGMMNFNSNQGGFVSYAMEDVATAKTDFLSAVSNLTASTWTPLSETMYEATRYYRGMTPDYGTNSVSTAISGSKYISPITSQCQKNFIVYLTDGDPTEDTDLTSSDMTGVGANSNCSTYGVGGYQSNCLDELAFALNNNDQSSKFIENQTVRTFTIGFGTGMSTDGVDLLKSAAKAGNGSYYPATDTSSLINVFTSIVGSILQSNSTFSSPAVSVNAFNRTAHLDHLYFSLFRPEHGVHWDGNFKRYRLDFDSNGDAQIVDVNGSPAIDTVGGNGYFKEGARSFWTPDHSGWNDPDFPNGDAAPDGKDARAGGTASVLTNNRKVYTYLESQSAPKDLTATNNAVNETNTAITQAMLGVSTSAERTSILQWARGIDVNDEDDDGDTTEARKIMGDPLHGEPALISYGGTVSLPDMTAYVPTNDGYLHAFDTRTGSEIFSFIPEELLGNLLPIYNHDTASTKQYGLDGSVTAWVDDTNKDGIISGSEHAYIYFGMRRGGDNYYALDVTDRSNPKVLWTIHGGTGDFAELGQTWSRPKLRKLRLGGQDRYVLIFGGGYDTTQDGANTRTTDSVGRAVYIVDAQTGQRLWWASSDSNANLTVPNMKYSIPSDVSVVDTVGDGYANLIYVGDMGGQIWRFDISKSESLSTLDTLITGDRIADLALDSSATNARRFYYPPEVALTEYQGKSYIALVIGSGYRAHPLYNDVQDRIYMIKDFPIKRAPTTYATITESDLFNTTDNAIGQGNASQQQLASSNLSSASGWYIDLEATGEKALAKAVVFGGTIYQTTYLPTVNSGGSTTCAPKEGSGRLYIMDLNDGRPTYTNDPTVDKSDLVKEDRYINLSKAGIPADPKFIKTENPNQKDWAVCIGTECFTMPDTSVLTRLYWFER